MRRRRTCVTDRQTDTVDRTQHRAHTVHGIQLIVVMATGVNSADQPTL